MKSVSKNTFVPRLVVFFLTILATCYLECSSDGSENASPDASADAAIPDLSQTLFAPDHLIEVEIEMDPADWDLIRNQGRRMVEVFSGCPGPFEYTYVEATVTVDGERFENTAVRKKGYLGSLTRVRPSLKLNFGRNVPGRTAWGMKRMTLNNDKQDSSHTHQCMSYQLFRQADSLAPRCNFARVTVNGRDLGIYSHVESIKKPFLARYFNDNDGNLYEGQLADFYPGMIDKFELKTNEIENDRSDLDRVLEAMDVDDGELFDSLDQIIDMDAFLTHWAVEVITGHWDSYSGDQNNFYTYHDPTTDRFYFIPWGTDGAFARDHAFLPPDIPSSVYAWSWPTFRLYSDPGSRSKYQERLRQLLDEVWDREQLLAEVDRIGELTSADESSLENQYQFIRTRKQTILDELDGGNLDWVYTPKTSLPTGVCLPSFEVSGEFDTTWGTLDRLSVSETSSFDVKDGEVAPLLSFLDFHTEEIRQPASQYKVSAGPADGSNEDVPVGTPTIAIVKEPQSGDTAVLVALFFEPSIFGEKEISFHALETFGAFVRSDGNTANDVILGFVGDGTVVFEEVGTTDGAPVKGSFSGVFVPMIFDQLR